jgi:hypothetical protein
VIRADDSRRPQQSGQRPQQSGQGQSKIL